MSELKSSLVIGDYRNFNKLVSDNLGLLIYLKKARLILNAANNSDNENIKLEYIIVAVLINPSLLATAQFSHLSASFLDYRIVNNALRLTLKKNGNYPLRSVALIRSFLGEKVSLDSLDINDTILSYSLLGEDQEIVKIFVDTNIVELNTQSVNFIVSSLICTNSVNILPSFVSKYRSLISNANLVKYFHSQGLTREGYSAMKKRDVSLYCADVFKDKYIQDLNLVKSDEYLLVLSSWGVGDDIRYSKIIPIILKTHSKVYFSCEPRLLLLFESLYPEAKFIPSHRTKFISKSNHDLYSEIIESRLYHAMDNELYRFSDEVDKVCLSTDLLSGIDFVKNGCKEFNCAKPNLFQVIDAFVSEIRKESIILVGLCWRSMLLGPFRNDNYFDLEELLSQSAGRNIYIVSLQYDLSDSERELVNKYNCKINFIEPPINQLNDFISVLYLMSKLDFIISAGTAVLELAGISGSATYLLSNSSTQRYRFKDNNDIWFENIKVVDDFYHLSKQDVITSTLDIIEKKTQ
ncbi:hypothetical protein KP803_08140 [Vibrio sp. ZSDE26]|uniref:Uncharacterized protein n=1 Tax=Vibrio amylolyticus TaxID=2847292 RepID=A0A9X1XLU3_9VIBR|nr:hypothetical protein [Vibrio amylolyticus]MCK6263245.1 hypothetical protein [Vibrio amylolyticus]